MFNKILFIVIVFTLTNYQDSNVELAITPTHIDANIKHNVAGYIVIAFGKKNREKICPGDFVFITYDDVPIIQDMQCGERFEDAVPDHEMGGHNDWYIDDIYKYSKGGWMVKARRRLITRDNFDDQFPYEEPDKILYAVHNSSYELTKPTKTGIRSISKFEKYAEQF